MKIAVMTALCLALTSINVSAKGIPVKVNIPKTATSCSKDSIDRMLLAPRNVAYESHSFWSGPRFYDINENCTISLRPGCTSSDTLDYRSNDPGSVFKVRLSTYKETVCISTSSSAWSENGEYSNYVREEQEALKQEAERQRLESTVFIPIPKYAGSDPVMKLVYNEQRFGYPLDITNTSSDFIRIVSISTYLDDEINTISDIALEMAPESTSNVKISEYTLIPHATRRDRKIKRRELDDARKETTKLGFAVRYLVNGVEKRYYSVQTFNNSDLLKGIE